eukprot:06571.XXX_150307_151858_1 [CDS] Oithona nana genome sequencing.
MGMVQSCFTAWNWFQPSLVNLETEDSKPKVYSWDTKKIDLTQYSFENLQEQTVVKAPGSIEGEQFMVRNCINCNIYLLDHINTITIDDCKNCKIFIGPTKGSLFIRDCSDCVLIAVCGQFRTRDCTKITTFLCCATQPIIEATTSIKFGCFQASYPELEQQFDKAELSPYNNLWWNIHDFTPNTTGDGPNWSILGEFYKVQDFIDSPENYTLKFDNSTVPSTIGTRNRYHDNESTLTMIFHDEVQNERAKKIVESLKDNTDQLELVKSRKLTLDASDAERLFSNISIRQNSMKGPLIGLQISGPGCLQKVIEISETVRKSTGCQRDMIYCSGSSEEARKDINNLFQFVEMQLGF